MTIRIGDTVKILNGRWDDEQGKSMIGMTFKVVPDDDNTMVFINKEKMTIEFTATQDWYAKHIEKVVVCPTFKAGDRVKLTEYYALHPAGTEGVVESVRRCAVDGVPQMVNVHFGANDLHGRAIGVFSPRLELVERGTFQVENILDLITATSYKVGTGDTQAILMSLVEEVGELATELNIENGTKNREPSEDGVKGEAVDVLIVIGDMLTHLFGSLDSEELKAAVERKLTKWESK